MKYGVIICPSCGKARGVETSRKSTTCQCGRELKLSRMKFHMTTDTPHELALAVARANELLAEGKKLPVEKGVRRRASPRRPAKAVKTAKDPLEELRLVALELTRKKGDFDLSDLEKVAPSMGKGSAESVLARLVANNLVYEVSEGRFRAV